MNDAVIIGLLIGLLVALLILAGYQNSKNKAFNEGIKGKANKEDVDSIKKELDKIEVQQERLREDLPKIIANAIAPTQEKLVIQFSNLADIVAKHEANTASDMREIRKFLLKE